MKFAGTGSRKRIVGQSKFKGCCRRLHGLSSFQHSKRGKKTKYLRTVCYVTKENRPITDHESLTTLHETNETDIGSVLHGRATCTSMIKVISDTIKSDVCAQIVQTKSKFH